MRFELIIESEDDACTEGPLDEVLRSLRNVEHKLDDGERSGVLLDINGNTIGLWSLKIPPVGPE